MLQSQASRKKTVFSKQWVTVFSIGGRRFAAGMEEVSGIAQCIQLRMLIAHAYATSK